MKNFKHIEKLEEFYSEPMYTYHFDSMINILLYLFYNISTHLATIGSNLYPYFLFLFCS